MKCIYCSKDLIPSKPHERRNAVRGKVQLWYDPCPTIGCAGRQGYTIDTLKTNGGEPILHGCQIWPPMTDDQTEPGPHQVAGITAREWKAQQKEDQG